MKNGTKYKQEFINTVFSNLINYELLGIDLNEMYIFNNKEKQILEKLKQQYRKIILYNDAETEYLEQLDPNLIISLANKFLVEIFPDFHNEILRLDKLLKFKKGELDDSGLFYILDNDKIDLKEIIINNDFNAYAISIIVHEKTHALAFDHIDTKTIFTNGLELFPIFIQNIVMYELENTTNFQVTTMNEIIRCIDGKNSAYYLDYADNIRKYPNEQLDYYVSQYFRIKSTDYLLSDVYSKLLLNYYIKDRNTMIENINKVFAGKITIPEFLNRYNINLLNKEIIPVVKKDLEKCKRKIIIP